ncbi:hypothetical protein A8C32_16930 [Flavivirga aquatica]|uniref:Carbohydrate-binding protein SusD n=1 Tax=Flavivirga aquatica TaxID=1849968 RepID=A0A1E5T8G4_9FLAO|nr:RagB/SusD family nutrient uptake outer membrane protein [Flavivirga aquatica]OEK07663.1 hypothetical protein A8C32_16930 [Flavivirga aquatica]
MKNLKFLFIVLFIGSMTSCDDDYLTETNPSASPVAGYWNSLQRTDIGLAAAYNALLHKNILTINEEAWRSDMGWPGFGRPVPSSKGVELFIYNKAYSSSDGFIEGKWNACYTGIFRANQVIGALEILKENFLEGEFEAQEEEWTLQMAQARFIRGLLHFYLHTIYNKGSVIINDRLPITREDLELPFTPQEAVIELLKDLNQPLSSSQEVLNFFRADLTYAFNNLPAQYKNPSIDKGRATKGAAATILGTSHLYEEEYSQAMTFFDDIINNPEYGYELVNDMNLMFTTEGEFNKESILELNYTSDFNQDLSIWANNVLTNQYAVETVNNKGPLLPAWIIDAYKTEALDPSDERNFYNDPVNGRSIRNLPLRAAAMVAIVEDDLSTYYLDGTTPQKVRIGWNGWGFGVYKKYTNHDIYRSEDANPDPRGNRASAKNVVINRLAEVYLMQAECFIKTGDVPAALRLINAIRKRWGLELLGPLDSMWPDATYNLENYTADALMEHLMYLEKPLELSLEGNSIRWTDLRRWGVIKENFQRLSDKTFYAINYTFRKLDGTTANKNSSSIHNTLPSPAPGLRVVDYEYDDTNANYNPELHDYLPIPLGEILRNSNINL